MPEFYRGDMSVHAQTPGEENNSPEKQEPDETGLPSLRKVAPAIREIIERLPVNPDPPEQPSPQQPPEDNTQGLEERALGSW